MADGALGTSGAGELLLTLKPRTALEIGTAGGGSAAMIRKHCKKLYSLDMRHPPELLARLKTTFPDVEFATGKTQQTLAPLLQSIFEKQEDLEFILVDGSHKEEGVRRDLEDIFNFRPRGKCIIVMHDSFNPGCRRGINTAPWEKNPRVRSLELSFVPGIYSGSDNLRRQMWGGFALTVLDGSSERVDKVRFHERLNLYQELTSGHSVHAGSMLPGLKSSIKANLEVGKLRHGSR